MALTRKPFPHAGGMIFDAVASDGTDTTIYSDIFNVSKAEVWSLHIEADETSATYGGTVTLWATNKSNPDPADDTDWVQMTANGGWDGFPNLTSGNFSGGDEKDFVDVGVSGALFYRLKIARTGGAADISCWFCQKGLK